MATASVFLVLFLLLVILVHFRLGGVSFHCLLLLFCSHFFLCSSQSLLEERTNVKRYQFLRLLT